MMKKNLLLAALLWVAPWLFAALPADPAHTLTLLHVSDTHSHFEPSQARFTIDLDPTLKAKALTVELGGFPQLAQVLSELRQSSLNPVVVHAGDFFQGTLYFTQYSGVADIEFWNSQHLDVATLGNHEFDLGPLILRQNFLATANFPVVTTNLDWSQSAVLKSVEQKPWVVKTVGEQKVGFIGLTTTDTPFISNPSPDVKFLPYAEVAQRAVDALKAQGVNRIVVVSHIGFDEDLKLATQVPGIDVIIGGHSHTLLGDWSGVGLKTAGAYPTKVPGAEGTVLVVAAWEWAKVVGALEVSFDDAGLVTAWQAKPRAVVGATWFRLFDVPGPTGELKRIEIEGTLDGQPSIRELNGTTYVTTTGEAATFYQTYVGKLRAWFAAHPQVHLAKPDPAAQKLTAKYAAGVAAMKAQVVAQVGVDLVRGLNQGPGPLVAEAYAAKTGAQIALSNTGGIRTNLLAGPLTVAGLYELIPFGNTLVTMKATGREVVAILEDGIDFSLVRYGHQPDNPLIYAAGLKFTVNLQAPKGSRVTQVTVKQADGAYAPLDPQGTYALVVNNFMASGGDKNDTLKALDGKIDTGFTDAEALLDYVKGKPIGAPEVRIQLAP